MNAARHHTESAVLASLGERLAHTRLQRNLTQEQVATAAGLSKRTVERIEAGKSNQLTNLIRLFRALGIVEQFEQLAPEPPPSPIAQLERQQGAKPRQRASRKSASAGKPTRPWTWGNEK
jgi:transcriptional regulator with XRE-family HTH domain